jgi:5-methylcytosine-specific restriction enzyme A
MKQSKFIIVEKMDATPRIRIPAEVRKYVFERDRYQCQSCGKTDLQTKLTVDHIVALTLGGSNDISNLQTLCHSCNSRKNNKVDPRFQQRFCN